jgi:hypothetical protein
MRADSRTGSAIPPGTPGMSLTAASGKARPAGRRKTLKQASAATRRPALIAAAAAIGALAAACGSAATVPSSPSSGPAATAPASSAPAVPATQSTGKPTSCSVITQPEASAALGQQADPPVMGKAYVEGGVACVFDGPNAPPGADPDIPYADTVRVVLVTGSQAKKYFDDYRSKVSAQPISGLGDAAFYDGFASISVLKGDAYVRIAVGIADNLSAEKTLAADALPRM